MENKEKKEESCCTEQESCCCDNSGGGGGGGGCGCGGGCSCGKMLLVIVLFLVGGIIGYLLGSAPRTKCMKMMGGMGCPMMSQMHQPDQQPPK